MTRGDWRKSSHCSSGACVEAGLQGARWRKSRRSESGACVEAGQGQGTVAVRDTKLAESPVLTFGSDEWARFTSAVKANPSAVSS